MTPGGPTLRDLKVRVVVPGVCDLVWVGLVLLDRLVAFLGPWSCLLGVAVGVGDQSRGHVE